jgi:hypothetical protein
METPHSPGYEPWSLCFLGFLGLVKGFSARVLAHSRRHLALGRRFFALLVIPEESSLVGAAVALIQIPCPFWSACREVNEFVQ